MHFTLTLIDINVRLVAAWREAFAGCPDVEIALGSILGQEADAWVTPTNSAGSMDGGLDAVMKRYFGDGVEARVQREIAALHGGHLPVGRATCVSTAGLWAPPGGPQPRFLISAPTMCPSSQNISRTCNVALATAAALHVARVPNDLEGGSSIRSIALPGLGASTGRVPPRECAAQMRAAYDVLRETSFGSFEQVHEALAARLREPGRAAVRRAGRRRILGIF